MLSHFWTSSVRHGVAFTFCLPSSLRCSLPPAQRCRPGIITWPRLTTPSTAPTGWATTRAIQCVSPPVAAQYIINSNPLAPADAEVRLLFRPGDYPTDALFLGGGSNRRLFFEACDPNSPPVLRYNVPTTLTGFFLGPIRETWLLQAATNVTLAHFEAHNLILDGNWPAWAVANTHASPANVGATDAVIWHGHYTNQTRACGWWAGTIEPALLGTVGWTDPDASYQPGRSEALEAMELSTNSLVLVGTGWLTPTGYSRAYRQEVSHYWENQKIITTAKDVLNLNDPHLSVVTAGWTLITGEDVNGQEWIVGLATDSSGQSRGYVLVPQQAIP